MKVSSVRLIFFSTAVVGLTLLSQFGNQSSNGVAPMSSTNSTSVITPSRLALNTSALASQCLSMCIGGACNQTAVGTTTCLTCPVGLTLQDPPSQCLDLRMCYTYPWCSSVDAVVLNRLHSAIVNVSVTYVIRTNRTILPLDGSLVSSPLWTDLQVLYNRLTNDGSNMTRRAMDVADLANAWITGRLQDKRSVTTFFDDEAGYWTRYSYYQPSTPYVVYTATLKSRVCGNNWRPSNASDCARPSASAVNACSTLTASQLAMNGGVCV